MASLPQLRLRPAPSVRAGHDSDSDLQTTVAAPRGGDRPAHSADRVRRRRALQAVAGVALLTGALLAVVWGVSTPLLGGASDALGWLEARNDDGSRAVVTVALVTAGLLALVIAWARVTAPRRPVRLAGDRGTIAVAELEQRLEALWLERPDVIAARAAVENRHRRGVRVAGRLAVTADARLHETATAVALVTEMLVDGHLGVELAAAPRFELRYRELDLRAGRAHDFRAGRARAGDAGDAGGGDAR